MLPRDLLKWHQNSPTMQTWTKCKLDYSVTKTHVQRCYMVKLIDTNGPICAPMTKGSPLDRQSSHRNKRCGGFWPSPDKLQSATLMTEKQTQQLITLKLYCGVNENNLWTSTQVRPHRTMYITKQILLDKGATTGRSLFLLLAAVHTV